VPLRNYGSAFFAFGWLRRCGKGVRTALLALAGVAVTLPLALVVIRLLMSSDAAFEQLVEGALAHVRLGDGLVWGFEFLLGIPIALYIFAAVYGNSHRRHVDTFTASGIEAGLAGVRVIPQAVFIVPLLLCGSIYLVYIGVQISSLVAALQGELHTGFTYAGYARQGFFELLVVAIINLVLLAVSYLFAARQSGRPPLALRIVAGLLTFCTCLLVVTALAKMLLYIDVFALSRLRLYTTWFLLLLLICFVLLGVWHLRRFNVGRPLIIVTLVMALVLFNTNTDALIADYNVSQYLNGHVQTMDVDMLAHMSGETRPALEQLAAQTDNPAIRREAQYHLKNN
jgi:hypothetical protein